MEDFSHIFINDFELMKKENIELKIRVQHLEDNLDKIKQMLYTIINNKNIKKNIKKDIKKDNTKEIIFIQKFFKNQLYKKDIKFKFYKLYFSFKKWCYNIKWTEEYYITEENIKKISLTDSSIVECVIKHNNDIISSNKSRYQTILTDIWKSMDSVSKIYDNTTFNIRLINDNESYSWYKDLKIAFQRKDANGTFKEILNMIKLNKYQIYICIQLKNKNKEILRTVKLKT